jgi:hypothetical protein
MNMDLFSKNATVVLVHGAWADGSSWNRPRKSASFGRMLNSIALETGKSYAGDMAQMQCKNMSQPDEKRSFDKGELQLVTLGGVTFGRVTLQPGWKWSPCVKPIAKTESCQAPHLSHLRAPPCRHG